MPDLPWAAAHCSAGIYIATGFCHSGNEYERQPEIFSLESILENVDPLAELASEEDEIIE